MNPITEIKLNQEKKEKIRVGIVQLDLNNFFKKEKGLLYPKNDIIVQEKYKKFLKLAKDYEVNILCFPELSSNHHILKELKDFADENRIIIIAGSFYNKERKNVCPIIIPEIDTYFTEKINLSPLEGNSPYADENPLKGDKVYIIKNSIYGSFAVLICADFLDYELKNLIYKEELDFLFVISLNNKSTDWHIDMNSDCKKNKYGIYTLYSNSIIENKSNGKSAIFGLIEKDHLDQGLDHSVEYKFMEIIDEDIIIADFNIIHKKPTRPNTIKIEPSILPVYPYSTRKQKRLLTFFNAVGLTEKRYKQIDELYVTPTNFSEIYDKLKKEKIVFLIGDPEIGKTYTSFKLLLESYRDGYYPVYREKSLETKILKINESCSKKVIYYEDPWGTTELKCVDIVQDICELIKNVSKYDTRIIITSRKKIIKKVEEILDNLCDLKSHVKELNVKKSYSLENLNKLLNNYISVFKPKWRSNSKILKLIHNEIDKGTLKTPMSIQKVIESNEAKDTENIEIIKKVISDASKKNGNNFWIRNKIHF